MSNDHSPGRSKDLPINTQSIAYRDGETELTGLLAWDDSRNSALSSLLAICMAMASPAIASV